MTRRSGKIAMTLATPPERTRATPPPVAARSWFRIAEMRNAAGEVRNDATRIDIYEEIGGWGVSAAEFVQQLRAIATPEVHLHVNSPGGSVFDGVAIFNALAQHPARVTAYVDGLAASAASFIVQAADEVIMNPGSMMMVHDAIGMTWGNAHDHTTMAGLLAQVSDSIAELYAMCAGGTAESWRAVMEKDGGEGQWYTAEQAVEAGLADRLHGAEPTAEEQAATGEPTPEAETPIDRYESSSIAAGHRLVLAHRDEALRMAPPPTRRFPARPEGAGQRIGPTELSAAINSEFARFIKAAEDRWLADNVVGDGTGEPLGFLNAPLDLAALAETMASVERRPHAPDPFIPFQ